LGGCRGDVIYPYIASTTLFLCNYTKKRLKDEGGRGKDEG